MTSFFHAHHAVPDRFDKLLEALGVNINDPRNLVALPTSAAVARDPAINVGRHTGTHSQAYFNGVKKVLQIISESRCQFTKCTNCCRWF